MVYKKFSWKEGSHLNADAQKVGEELEKIKNRDAFTVVEAARNPKTELNKIIFKLSDSEAVDEYRLNQARLILRSIVIIEKDENEPEQEVTYRAYEPVRSEQEPGTMVYKSSRVVMETPDLRKQYLERLEREIRGVEQSVEQYIHLLPSLAKTKKKLQEAREALPIE